jgi:hypothetical protein
MQHKQSQFIVNSEFVAIYGFKDVSSGLSASTLNVQQLPSSFSTLKTVEQLSPIACPEQLVVTFLVVGILQGIPFEEQVYNMTGLVLQTRQLDPPPNIGRSQESKELSQHAFS